jgi:pimeloyl-ACP methyl ester carboxylesterase
MEKMLQVMPQSTSAVVPRAGHLVAGDNPADFLKSLTAFLDTV